MLPLFQLKTDTHVGFMPASLLESSVQKKQRLCIVLSPAATQHREFLMDPE